MSLEVLSKEVAKSCPFCGDQFISINEVRKVNNTTFNGFNIGCQTIGCIGCHVYGHTYETRQEALDAWNRRS